jgi:3-oxoacyl-[acyl-carrier protein] reductase
MLNELPIRRALEGRRILITGASRGIGAVVADHLANLGAQLVLVARDERALLERVASLPGGPHDALPLDARDAQGWNTARDLIAPDGILHGVVTAAANLSPIGPLGSWDITRFRETLDLNVCGTLLAVLSNLGPLRAAAGSIVTFSGGGATGPMPRFDAYATSKTAVVRLTENIATDLINEGIRANSVAPGFVLTSMHEQTLAAGPDLVGAEYFQRTQQTLLGGGDSPQLAAELVAFLVSDTSYGITGKLLSARWDPWRDPLFQERLRTEKDLATLRRIDDIFYTAAEVSAG